MIRIVRLWENLSCKKDEVLFLRSRDRIQLPLEDLEEKCQDVTMETQQYRQGRSGERVASDFTGQAVTKGKIKHY